MNLSPAYRRALALLGIPALLAVIYTYWPESTSKTTVTAPVASASAESVDVAEKRLARLREIAATVPQKEEMFKQASADLALREKGLINADTAAQAQAQLIQLLRMLCSKENPPIAIAAQEIGAVRPLSDAYGEVLVSVQVNCQIDQLVNLLSALGSQPELIATNDLRVMSSNAKDKMIGVRLTVSGVVPRKLVPEKKGGAF